MLNRIKHTVAILLASIISGLAILVAASAISIVFEAVTGLHTWWLDLALGIGIASVWIFMTADDKVG